jgi:hypothetical protein
MRKLMLLLLLVSLAIATMPRADAQTAPPSTPMPVYNTDGTPVPNSHIVIGHVTVPPGWASEPRSQQFFDGIPVALEGAAAFTSADSYKCFLAQPFGVSPPAGNFRKIDGSHFGIRAVGGGAAWRQDFLCIGN